MEDYGRIRNRSARIVRQDHLESETSLRAQWGSDSTDGLPHKQSRDRSCDTQTIDASLSEDEEPGTETGFR